MPRSALFSLFLALNQSRPTIHYAPPVSFFFLLFFCFFLFFFNTPSGQHNKALNWHSEVKRRKSGQSCIPSFPLFVIQTRVLKEFFVSQLDMYIMPPRTLMRPLKDQRHLNLALFILKSQKKRLPKKWTTRKEKLMLLHLIILSVR